MITFIKSQLGISSLPQTRQESDAISEQEAMLGHEYHARKLHPQKQRLWSSNMPWIFTTIALTIYIFIFPRPLQNHHGPWSPTDLVPARPLIEESIKTFTAGLDYNNANHSLQHTPSKGLRFIGAPSSELDAAWEEIAGTQEIFLTREEAIASLVEDTFISPLTGLPVIEVETFHHLHCLNYIRKTIDIEHYPDIQEQKTRRIHVEHCINSIREYLMCKADVTPIVLVPPEKAGVPIPVPEFRTKHVCRDFEGLLNWVRKERSANLPEEESREIARKIREKTGTKY